MGFIICFTRKNKAKVISVGSSVDALTMLCTITKTVIEKIEKKKGLNHEEALKFVSECIAETDVMLDLDRLNYEPK